jgi:hypothetical protein
MPGKHLKNDTENKKHHSQSHQDGQHGKVNLQVSNRVKCNEIHMFCYQQSFMIECSILSIIFIYKK